MSPTDNMLTWRILLLFAIISHCNSWSDVRFNSSRSPIKEKWNNVKPKTSKLVHQPMVNMKKNNNLNNNDNNNNSNNNNSNNNNNNNNDNNDNNNNNNNNNNNDNNNSSENLTVILGRDKIIECPFHGSSNYTWFKDGEVIYEEGHLETPIRHQDKTLILGSLREKHSGIYTCLTRIDGMNFTKTFHVNVIDQMNLKPLIQKKLENVTAYVGDIVKLSCPVKKTFFFARKWYIQNLESDGLMENITHDGFKYNLTDDNEELSILITDNSSNSYTCLVENMYGKSYEFAWIRVVPRTETAQEYISKSTIVFLYIVLICCILLFLVALFFIYRKIKLRRKYRDYNESLKMVDNKLYFVNADYVSKVVNVSNEADHIKKWEISKKRIKYTKELGEGEFGVVLKADMSQEAVIGSRPVAVKMAKPGSNNEEMLWEEAKLMMKLEGHTNVLSLIGCCTRRGPLMIVMEYAPYGNLRDFLRLRRPNKSNHEYQNQLQVDSPEEFSNAYSASPPTNEYMTNNKTSPNELFAGNTERCLDADPKSEITYKTLLSFGRQVAKGMEFLALKQCLHRDLAARNVLVGENFVLKIADFGLSRNIYNQDYYKKTSKGRLPVKWMAPEVLFDNTYTLKSDIWSYGILLWEIFTFGGSPYPGIPYKDLCNLLKEGYRMQKPACSCDRVYDIMKRCWIYEANERLSFSEIIPMFDEAITLNRISKAYLDLYVDVKGHPDDDDAEK